MSADLLEQLSNQIRDRYGDELPFAKTLLELLHWHSAQIIELQKQPKHQFIRGEMMHVLPESNPVDNVDTSA